jgi:hypothetical protein
MKMSSPTESHWPEWQRDPRAPAQPIVAPDTPNRRAETPIRGKPIFECMSFFTFKHGLECFKDSESDAKGKKLQDYYFIWPKIDS